MLVRCPGKTVEILNREMVMQKLALILAETGQTACGVNTDVWSLRNGLGNLAATNQV